LPAVVDDAVMEHLTIEDARVSLARLSHGDAANAFHGFKRKHRILPRIGTMLDPRQIKRRGRAVTNNYKQLHLT